MRAPLIDHAATGQAPVGPVLLDTLNDEELVLLAAEHPLVQLPHYEQLTSGQQEHAIAGALRGLRARGLSADLEQHTIALPQHLCDVIDLRAAAKCVLMTQVVVPVGEDGGLWSAHYAYVWEDFVLLEDVTGDGLHSFWALDLRDLPAAIQERFAHCQDGRDGSGQAITVDLSEVAAGRNNITVDRIGQVLLQIDTTIWRAPCTPHPPFQAIVVGERGSYLSRAIHGGEGRVTLHPVAIAEMGEAVVRLLTPGTMPS